MHSALGWLRSVCLAAVIGLFACLQPAWAEPDAAASQDAAPSVQPQHGGGGFALLLLDYRLALEGLTEQFRARGAELMDGAQLFPDEMAGAWERVTEGISPTALIAGLITILGMALLARHAVRRRLSGASFDHGDSFGLRLGRALYRALVDLLALGAFALVAIGLGALFAPAPGAARTFVFTYLTAALVSLAAALSRASCWRRMRRARACCRLATAPPAFCTAGS